MSSATPAIEVVELEKHYGSTRAVDGLSLSVGVGEVFGLLGPNGAGKTTTVEILEGYRRPDRGTVRVLGLDPLADGAALRPKPGDCCVFCSYGSVPCPPVQMERSAGSPGCC